MFISSSNVLGSWNLQALTGTLPLIDYYLVQGCLAQSNDVGRKGPVNATLDATDPDILQPNINAGDGDITGFITATDPLNHWDAGGDTVGRQMTYLKLVLAEVKLVNPNAKVLYIPNGKGSTGLNRDWSPGDPYFEEAKARYLKVVELLQASGNTYANHSIIGHQGERDNGLSEQRYTDMAFSTIVATREYMGSQTIPYICGDLMPISSLGGARLTIQNISSNLTFSAFWASTGFVGDGTDTVHFTAAEQRIAGDRCYTAYSTSLSGTLSATKPSATTDLLVTEVGTDLSLSFTIPNSNGLPINNSIVEYKLVGSSDWYEYFHATAVAKVSPILIPIADLTLENYEFRVRFLNGAGIGQNSNIATIDLSPTLAAPSNNTLPIISGTSQSGQTLSVTSGSWSGNPTPTYTYLWKLDDVDAGTGNTLLLDDTDVGKVPSCVITATNSEGFDTATSANYDVVIAASSTFTPTDITSLEAWYDAADATTISETSGSLTQWDDKSGNDYHATQSVSSEQPTVNSRTINSLNVVDFDGTQMLDIPSGFYNVGENPNTIFVVYVSDDDTQNAKTIFGSNGGGKHFYIRTGSNANVSYNCATGNSQAQSSIANSVVTGATNIITGGHDNTSQYMYINGGIPVSGGTPTSITQTVCNISGPFQINGAIAEILVFSEFLSDADKDLVGSYLADKWGPTWVDTVI